MEYQGHRKGHGLGGFASPKVGKDGLTGRERAKLAGRKGAIAHAIKVYGHSKEEYENEYPIQQDRIVKS